VSSIVATGTPTNFTELYDLSTDPVHLPLLGSPLPAIGIIFIYFLLIFKVGPDFMESRKPYNVRTAMLIYNLCQVLMNSGIFIMVSFFHEQFCHV